MLDNIRLMRYRRWSHDYNRFCFGKKQTDQVPWSEKQPISWKGTSISCISHKRDRKLLIPNSWRHWDRRWGSLCYSLKFIWSKKKLNYWIRNECYRNQWKHELQSSQYNREHEEPSDLLLLKKYFFTAIHFNHGSNCENEKNSDFVGSFLMCNVR